MQKAQAIIRKKGDEYCVFSKDGTKNLGCSKTREGAVKRLRQIEFFKNKGSIMSYDKAFNNLGKAKGQEIDPEQIGRTPENTPRQIDIGGELSVAEKLNHGTIAGRRSEKLLDTKDHFPVMTQTQAQSSMTRVLQLDEVPGWYRGTIAELRQEVYTGIKSIHPDIEFNVRVPMDQAVALSDGETTPETKMSDVIDPADVVKNQGGVPRRNMTSAQVAKALEDPELRQVVAGRIMEMVDKNMEAIKKAKKMASALTTNGITAEDFDQLSTYIQEDILRELLMRTAVASTTSAAEDRRQELLKRMAARQED